MAAGVALYHDGDFELAVDALDRACAAAPAGPERARAHLFAGLSLAVLGRDADARRRFALALADDVDVAPDRKQVAPAVVETFDAVRASLRGRLEVVADAPAGLALDGEARGPLPFAGEVPIGRHTLLARSPDGLDEARDEVRVGPAAQVRVDLRLVRRTGVVDVHTDPSGATVTGDDGHALGATPLDGLALPAGEHRVRLSLPDRPEIMTVFQVDPDRPGVVRVSVPPAPDPPWYRRPRAWGWVSGAAAVAAGVTGGVFGWLARDSEATLRDESRAGTLDYDEYRRLSSEADDRALTANVLFGVAGALGATSVALIVWE